MAKKTQAVNILPYPSSSDDQSEDEEGSVSSTDDEEQQQEPQSEEESDGEAIMPDGEAIMAVVNQPSLQHPQESVDDSDADSFDSQNSPSASAFTVMPIVPKPISKSPQPETPTSKTIRARHPLEESEKFDKPVSINQEPGKTQGVNRKRPVETETENIYEVSKNKKSKVSDGDGQSVDKGLKGGDEDGGKIEERKSFFKWSEENEIALLLKTIDYKADTGNVVNSTMDAFYEYVKDSISVTLTKIQLYEKNRRLKNKFQTNVEKWQNGGEPVFSRPHEKKLFELSQKIWGSQGTLAEGSGSKLRRSNKTDKKDGIVVSNTNTERKSVANRELPVQEEDEDPIIEVKKEETQDFWAMYPLLSASLESEAFANLKLKFCDSKEYVKTMISGFGEEKARELEDGWKAVHVMDVQLYAQRVHLINEQAQAAAAAESLE